MSHLEAVMAEGQARTRLSRERVLASALELVDREGLSALSMRRLGAELGVEAMALYRHAGGKSALLDGLVEALYLELEERLAKGAELDVPGGVPAWRTGLHRHARAMYETCLAHRRIVPLLYTYMLTVPLARRPPAMLRDHERVLALIEDGVGLGGVRATPAFRAFTGWLLGFVAVELCAGVGDQDPGGASEALRVPGAEPLGVRVAASFAEWDGPEVLAAGLDALLDRLVLQP